MNVLIIDPHRSEYFWQPIANALAKAKPEWGIRIARTIPFDLYQFDIIINVYLNEILRDLSNNTANIPLVGICMGTDACVNSYRGTDSKRVGTVVTFNDNHQKLVKAELPFTNVVRFTWPADDSRLEYKPRTAVSGEPPTVKLLNIALHQYSKGLDNLVQQLEDATEGLDVKTELHVIGSMGPFSDYNQYLNFYLQWFVNEKAKNFKFIYHGDKHPYQIDQYIESISPSAYITASQGEQGATTVAEGLIKGFKVIALEHPFTDGLYKDFLSYREENDNKIRFNDNKLANKKGLYYYNTTNELRSALTWLVKGDYNSDVYHGYGLKTFGMEVFLKDFIELIKTLVPGRG